MCFTIALALPGMVLAASDTRWTYADGTRDWGQKVRRIPHGYATATGSAALATLGLRSLEATGAQDCAKARSGIKETCSRVRETVTTAVGDYHVGQTKFLLAREDPRLPSVHLVRADGSGEDHANAAGGKLLTTWAPGMEWREAESTGELKERLGAQDGSVEGILRTVGWALVHALQYGSEISEEIEVGFSVLIGGAFQAIHLRAHADWLEKASDADLSSRFLPPPQLPPFPALPSEQLLLATTQEGAE